MRSSYIAGYLKMLEKCAQFNYSPYNTNTPMYYQIGKEDQKELDRRMNNINNAQKKMDKTRWYNPLSWLPGLGAKISEGHNKRRLEVAKQRAANNAAASGKPVDWYTMKNLSKAQGAKFMQVAPDAQGSYDSVRDSIRRGFDDPMALHYLTQDVRRGRELWDASPEGQAAAARRQNSHIGRWAGAYSVMSSPLSPLALPGYTAAGQRGWF